MRTQAEGRIEGNVHLTAEQVESYASRSLAAADLPAIDRHLGGCATCRRTLRARMGTLRLPEEAIALTEPLHLDYAHIAAYIDGAATPTEKAQVEAHTFLCSSCSRELAELQQFDLQLAAPVEAAAPALAKVPLLQQIREFFQVPGRVREFGLAFGAIVAGIFVLFQADRGSETHDTVMGDQAARLVQSGVHAHPGLGLGGLLLLSGGLAYMAYSVWKKR